MIELDFKIYNKLPPEAKAIREEVFIKEQGFENEYDEMDEVATHIVAFDEGVPVATCRLFETENQGTFMFGRLAVKKELRKKGIGSEIVSAAQKYVSSQGGGCIILHSQLHAKDFYKKIGFQEFGEIEYEQGCPHIWMRKDF